MKINQQKLDSYKGRWGLKRKGEGESERERERVAHIHEKKGFFFNLNIFY